MNKIIKELSAQELNGTFPSNDSERTQAAKYLGRLGGQQSVKSRFKGKTKKEISELMRKCRLTKVQKKEFQAIAEEAVQSLNSSVLDSTKPKN